MKGQCARPIRPDSAEHTTCGLLGQRGFRGAEPDFAGLWNEWKETEFGSVNRPDVTAVLVPIEKAADSQLRELARAVDISLDKWVVDIGVGFGIHWEWAFARCRTCVEVGEDVVAVIWLVLRGVSYIM
jgi:hypothetical protein